jgi:hypothetical protein
MSFLKDFLRQIYGSGCKIMNFVLQSRIIGRFVSEVVVLLGFSTNRNFILVKNQLLTFIGLFLYSAISMIFGF